ncbi:GNAT family N-acetyltransferase [Paenibacillus marinisediminis]
MNYELRKLSISDDMDIYEMLQEIPRDENGFINSTNGRTFEEYKQWLTRSEAISKAEGLEDWMVPSNTYWLYANGYPVGFGKLRHYLTEKLREEGGHVGYTIRPSERKKGYGSMLLKLMLEEAKSMNIDKVLLTVQNNNTNSIKVALNNNGIIERSNEDRHYIWIEC